MRKKREKVVHTSGRIEIPENLENEYIKKVQARTENQKKYIRSVMENDLVIVTGPAGVGKSFISVGMALDMLNKDKIQKMIFIRPALEAGESIGFIPGDIDEKLDPYMRPLFDALDVFLPQERIIQLKRDDCLEVAPVGFLRGRTFNNCFIILDEAQNMTLAQLELAVTRLGEGSKIVITGDLSQSDLHPSNRGALELYRDLLGEIEGVGIVELEQTDIQRHALVGKILAATKGKTLNDRLSLKPRTLEDRWSGNF